MEPLKKVPAHFYRTANGNEPVREWLLSLNEMDRKLVGVDIATLEYGWPVGMPLSRPLGAGLWEIRTHLTVGKIARVMFAVEEQHLLLLHGFIKKTQKTPRPDLNLALKRLKEML
jgi:phage-related protein